MPGRGALCPAPGCQQARDSAAEQDWCEDDADERGELREGMAARLHGPVLLPVGTLGGGRAPTRPHAFPHRADLVPKDVLTSWLKHLREELPTVPFKSSTQQQARNLSHKQIKADVGASLRGSECLGARGGGTPR